MVLHSRDKKIIIIIISHSPLAHTYHQEDRWNNKGPIYTIKWEESLLQFSLTWQVKVQPSVLSLSYLLFLYSRPQLLYTTTSWFLFFCFFFFGRNTIASWLQLTGGAAHTVPVSKYIGKPYLWHICVFFCYHNIIILIKQK